MADNILKTENHGQYTVFLCDDEVSILRELENTIAWEQFGISIVGTASTGEEAIRGIINRRPTIAIMDIRMPDCSGLDVIRRINNAGIHTEFIILSGFDEFAYAKEAILLGAKAYLLKPLDIQELYEVLYRICVEKEMRNNAERSILKCLDENFFQNLLDGKIPEESMIDFMLRQSMLHITNSACSVYVIIMEGDSSPIETEKAVAYFNHAFRESRSYFLAHGKNQIAAIVNVSDQFDLQLAEQILQLAKHIGLGRVYVGIGDVVSGLMQCSYSYNRALTALTYRLYNDNLFLFSSDMICEIPPSFRMTDMDYLRLIQCIVQHNLSGIEEYCDEFMSKVMYVTMPPPNYVYGMCYNLYYMIEKELASYSNDEISAAAFPKDVYHFQKIDEIKVWLVREFCALSEYVDAVYGYGTASEKPKNVPQVDDEIIRTAKTFIHRNVAENIRIEDIAEHVHLSASYFSIYFKQKTGINLRNYIMSEKMEYARKALLDPGSEMTEVAERLGYQEYRSFSRAFKKIHGMTPSEFQSKHRL